MGEKPHTQVHYMPRRPRSAVNLGLRQGQLSWLRHIEQRFGVTPTQIARRAGLDPSTLTGFKAGRRSQTLEALTVSEISRAWGVPVDADVSGTPAAQGFGEDAVPFSAAGASPMQAALRELIGGRNNLVALTLRSPALELIGFMVGDVVLVDLSNATPQPGDAVYAQVYDWRRMSAETVVRVYETVHAYPVDTCRR